MATPTGNAKTTPSQPSPNATARARAALVVLIVLHLTMVAALMTQTPPHPPFEIPLFGLAPFFGVALALMAAALHLGATGTRDGLALSAMSVLLSLLSFGPQKWIDPAFPSIWPAVIVAQLAIVVLATSVWRGIQSGGVRMS